jgi:hypothetical protein
VGASKASTYHDDGDGNDYDSGYNDDDADNKDYNNDGADNEDYNNDDDDHDDDDNN